jgi:hypothetical protein
MGIPDRRDRGELSWKFEYEGLEMSRPRLSIKIVSLPVITGLAFFSLVATPAAWSQTNISSLNFSFSPGNVATGCTQGLPSTACTRGLGWGRGPVAKPASPPGATNLGSRAN